ncbi:MAG: tetratricopeptide repeat protein [Saprospiraceae bacterium]|nr:tetratricopeptide repeat protein [Saprospiraceae bacterium]
MKLNVFLLLLIGLLSLQACGGDQTATIEQLEAKVEENPTPEDADALITLYREYIDTHPADTEQNSRYLYRAAGLMYRLNRHNDASMLLKEALKDYYGSDQTANNAYLLASIQEEKLNNPVLATSVYQAIDKAFPSFEQAAEVKSKLSADLPPIQTRIDTLAKGIFDLSTGRVNRRTANNFIESCDLYSMIVPEDPLSPELLHKAGEAARATRAFNSALDIYDRLYKRYPDFEKAPQALFLMAFTLDNDLQRHDEAKTLYESFLEKYPDDDFADDTQFLLKNLGKTDEEIIQSFEDQEESE